MKAMRKSTGLEFDHELAIKKLMAADRRLGQMIERVGPFKLIVRSSHTPFESLVRAIVYQQLTGKAAATILARLQALFDASRLPTPHELLSLPADTLRSAGLSRAKVAALQDLAEKTLDGTVPTSKAIRQMPDEEIIARLVSIRGVGVWTVEMLLIFLLGRPDVLPIHDYGLRKGFARTFRCPELPQPKQVAARGERWRPYRTVASWYLWRAAEL